MKLPRFYIGDDFELKHDFWVHDAELIHQWNAVLGLKNGQDVLLTNDSHERLYKIVELKPDEAHLQHITDFKHKTTTEVDQQS